uniref:Uncharacterized protein n=1 Tax=Strigamia maritima TaxID=126957 RepID=T1JHZ0_STRMM
MILCYHEQLFTNEDETNTPLPVAGYIRLEEEQIDTCCGGNTRFKGYFSVTVLRVTMKPWLATIIVL